MIFQLGSSFAFSSTFHEKFFNIKLQSTVKVMKVAKGVGKPSVCLSFTKLDNRLAEKLELRFILLIIKPSIKALFGQ